LKRSLIPRNEIRQGGPGKDGIPSLTEPRFLSPSKASFLKADDRVIGVAIGREARAYPLRILDWHEAVNDRMGGIPLLVTYCPLCDSAAVFDRRTSAGELQFGISGLLYNNNVLLYDRTESGDESLWSQMMAQAVSGPRAGQRLKVLPCELTLWNNWKTRYPHTLVLSTDTGYRRVYSASPYAMYFRHNRLMFPIKPIDKRLPLKTPVLGVWVGPKARAYPLSAFDPDDKPVRLGQELDGARFTVVYDPVARSLRVEKAGPRVRWMYAFWFAWYAFHPETDLFASSTARRGAARSR